MSRYKVSKDVFVAFIFIIIIVSFQVVISLNFPEDLLDPYETDKFYYNWIDDISNIEFNISIFKELSTYTSINIAAPEPFSAYFYFLSIKFFNLFFSYDTALYLVFIFPVFLQVIVIYIALSRYNCSYVIYTIVALALSFGYYEFVDFNIVHRLKIAVLILSMAFLFSNKRKYLAEFLLVVSCLTHLSIFILIPFLYIMKRVGYVSPFNTIKSFFLCSCVLVFLSYFLIFNAYESIDLFFQSGMFISLDKKIMAFDILGNTATLVFFICMAFISPVIYFYAEKYKILYFLGAVFYLGTVFYILGTSRVLMIIYFVLGLFFITNVNYKNNNLMKIISYFLILFLCFNFYKMLSYIN